MADTKKQGLTLNTYFLTSTTILPNLITYAAKFTFHIP